MPSELKYENRIPGLYKRKVLDIFLYGYVSGIIDHLPSVTIRSAINSFLIKHKISEDDLSLDYAVQIYYKMRDEVAEFNKNKK